LKREGVRLICLAELFGAKQTEGAMEQVMKSGHVGADYVEHVLRKQGSSRPRHLIRLGDEALDSIALSEPDLSVYDIRESE
jgi:hypothetical protein